MLAYVLSGAANYGAMQAGALEVLLASGWKPDMVVGTSAGALNAIYIASNPTPEGARELGAIWEEVGPGQVGRGGLFTGLRRVMTRKESLLLNEPLVEFVQGHLLPNVNTFGDLAALHQVRAYAMAVCMENGELVAFGDQESDRLVDGVLSSTAIPPYFPPWKVDGRRYVDGGVTAKLPILAANQRGARQVIALDVENTMGSIQSAKDLFGISGYALSLMAAHQTHAEIAYSRASGAAVRVITLPAPVEVSFWDFSKARRLYRLGNEIAQRALDVQPLSFPTVWIVRLRSAVRKLVFRLVGFPAPFGGLYPW
ncbi:MAG: patatin-like phospholipase family protein [Chloroflexota bacterium]